MKQFVFSIDSKEHVITTNSILEAVEEVKQVIESTGKDRNLKFVGVKY